MWFRLVAFPSCPNDLCGIVGIDRNIYWRLTDIGRFLGYKNPYTFGINGRQKHKMIKDVVPPVFDCSHPTVRIVNFEEMLNLMSTKRYRFDARALLDVWTNGRIVVPDKMYISHNYKDAMRLVVVDGHPNHVPLQEFISMYTDYVIHYYNQVTVANESFCIKTESNMELATNNVIPEQTSPEQITISPEQITTLVNPEETTISREQITTLVNPEEIKPEPNSLENVDSCMEQPMDQIAASLSDDDEEEVDPHNIYMGCDGLRNLPETIFLMWNKKSYAYRYSE